MNHSLPDSLFDNLMTAEDASKRAEEVITKYVISMRDTDVKNMNMLRGYINGHSRIILSVLGNAGIDQDLLEIVADTLLSNQRSIDKYIESLEKDKATVEVATLESGRIH